MSKSVGKGLFEHLISGCRVHICTFFPKSQINPDSLYLGRVGQQIGNHFSPSPLDS